MGIDITWSNTTICSCQTEQICCRIAFYCAVATLCLRHAIVVYQSHKIVLQYVCILHFVLQSGGLSQLNSFSKTHRQNHHEFYEGMCYNSDN